MIHPKPYLSYTQRQLWKRSPERYMDMYWRGGCRFTTREMAYGSKMSKSIEISEETGDPLLDLVVESLPKLDRAEVEIRCSFKSGRLDIPLFGKLDHAKNDLSAFLEYKTGKTKWNQAVVDEDEQITWYVMLIYIVTGRVVEDMALVHAVTEDTPDGGVRATGEINVYKTKRTYAQVLKMMADAAKVWREIGEACEKEMI